MGASIYGASNPAGSFYDFGGSPKANFGFAFTGLSNAPEPFAIPLSLSGAMLTGGRLIRRRRTRV
jgi:hypothetical protein